MNREVCEKQLRNQSSQYEKCIKNSVSKRKPLCATTKLTHLAVVKINGIQRRILTSKSMKKALYVLWYAKRHLSG